MGVRGGWRRPASRGLVGPLVREGVVDAMASQPPMTDVLAREGFPLLLDPTVIYPGGRPDKVIVATERAVAERPDELTAFLRGNVRAFWDMRNADNFAYLQDLESRLRAGSHNDDERRLRIVSSVEKTEGWNLPVHGCVVPETLERVVGGLAGAPEVPDRPRARRRVLAPALAGRRYALPQEAVPAG